jgi:hypothetical protein
MEMALGGSTMFRTRFTPGAILMHSSNSYRMTSLSSLIYAFYKETLNCLSIMVTVKLSFGHLAGVRLFSMLDIT